MPYRLIPFAAGEIYHVFNRSIASQPIFRNSKDYQRLSNVINYYKFHKLPLRFSHYNRLATELKEEFTQKYLNNNKPMLDILAYCIMPNHFHFLLQPFTKAAISDFMRNTQNSYSKYFNTKYKRTGSLFQFMFKGIRIETDEQLLHVSRYIHLNPVTSYLIDVNMLGQYPWSSFKNYVSTRNDDTSFVNSKIVLNYFKLQNDYKQFVFDQVDYQRQLERIKHLILEKP